MRKCWFVHVETKSYGSSCNLCDEDFAILPDYRQHKKIYHKQRVKNCTNETNGSCIYGKNKCWFNHKEKEEINGTEKYHDNIEQNENKEVIQSIVKMMETLTERIVNIERQEKMH